MDDDDFVVVVNSMYACIKFSGFDDSRYNH